MARKASKDTSKSRPERSAEPVALGKEAAAGFALWREAMRWQRSVNGALLGSFYFNVSRYFIHSALFAGIDDVRFKRIVRPGEVLDLECVVETVRGPVGRGKVKATVDGKLAVRGTLTFAVGDEE